MLIPTVAFLWAFVLELPGTLSAPLREAKGLTDEQILKFYSLGTLASFFSIAIYGYILARKGVSFIFVLYGIV